MQVLKICLQPHRSFKPSLQVLAVFENGRLEEFLDFRTLEPSDMAARDMAARIAKRLKQFHAVEIEGSREPQSFIVIKKWCAATIAWYPCPGASSQSTAQAVSAS